MMKKNSATIAACCGILLLFMLIPLFGYYFCATNSIGCSLFSWLPKVIFPVQLFPVIQFIFWFLLGSDFWPIYIAYLFAVVCLVIFTVKKFHRWGKARILTIYVLICAILFVVNVGLWDIQTSLVFRARPAQPMVQ